MRRLATCLVAAVVTMGLAGCGDVLKGTSLTVGTSFSRTVQLTAPDGTSTSASKSVTFSPGSDSTFQENKSKLTQAGLDSLKIEITAVNPDATKNATPNSITGVTVKLTDVTTKEWHAYSVPTITLAQGTSVTVKNFVETESSTGQPRAIGDFFSTILTRPSSTNTSANDFTLDLAGNLDKVPVDVTCQLTMGVSLTITGG